jgi:hypothetical protein
MRLLMDPAILQVEPEVFQLASHILDALGKACDTKLHEGGGGVRRAMCESFFSHMAKSNDVKY